MGMKPRPALEGLERVAWTELEHAYGDAGDVPDLLRGLASPVAGTRQRAFAELDNRVCHQGWASPAAAEVVPFLIDLACDTSVADRGAIVRLIGDLSVGGMHTQHLADGYVHRAIDDPELAWLERLHASVADARVRLAALYADADADVRASVSLALALLGEHAGELAPAVRAAARRERKAAARASAIIALGVLGRVLGSLADRERFEAALADRSAVVRTAGAIGLSYIVSPPPADAVSELARAAQEGERSVAGLPWAGGDLADLAARVLALRGGVRALVDFLASAPRLVAGDAAGTIARANTARQVLELAFPSPLPAGATASDLTDEQRHAVTALSANHLYWDERLTPQLGLPQQPEDARAWLGLPEPALPPTALDETLDGQMSIAEAWIQASAGDDGERGRLLAALHERFDAGALFALWLAVHTRLQERWRLGPHAVALHVDLLTSLGDAAEAPIRARLADVARWGSPSARIKNQKGRWFTTTYSYLNGWYAVALARIAAGRGEQPDDVAFQHLRAELSTLKPLPQVCEALRAFDLDRRVELVLRIHRGDYWWLAPSSQVTEWAHYYLSCIPTAEAVATNREHFDRYTAALREADCGDDADRLDAAVAARLA